MSWRVLVTDAAFEGLAAADQEVVSSELFSWIENGPPMGDPRTLFGVQLYEDQLPSGCRVTYFINEVESYAAVVRVRRG